MIIAICKRCNAEFTVDGRKSVEPCHYCGSLVPLLHGMDDGARVNAFKRAEQNRRNGDFDEAARLYRKILDQDLTDAEEEDRCIESEELIRQGVTFLHGLAETLKSPEASARLVNTLVHTDPETGKQELRIPIPGKDAAGSILTFIARLMSK